MHHCFAVMQLEQEDMFLFHVAYLQLDEKKLLDIIAGPIATPSLLSTFIASAQPARWVVVL